MNTKDIVKRATPAVLTVASCIGVLGTAVASHFGTKKAMNRLSEKNLKPETWKDELKETWKDYILTGVCAAATIGTVVTNTYISTKDMKAILATATAISGASRKLLDDYKEATKETFGEEGYERVVKQAAKKYEGDIERAEVPTIYGSTIGKTNASPTFEGDDIFYDEYTKRWFKSSTSAVLNGILHWERNFSLGYGFVSFEMLYSLWGLKSEDWYKDAGYGYLLKEDGINWIDVNLIESFTDDGTKYYIISYDWMPGSYEEEMEYDV